MEKPIILLKSIDLHVGLSEETPAYTARLYVDGVHFADVSNSGHGGCDMVNPPLNGFGSSPTKGFYDRVKDLEDRIKATYPGHDYDYGPIVKDFDEAAEIIGDAKGHMDESLEGLCHVQAWESVERRNLKSRLSRKVVMVKDGKVYSIAGKKSPAQIDRVAERYPEATILNSLSFDDAFVLFKEHAS